MCFSSSRCLDCEHCSIESSTVLLESHSHQTAPTFCIVVAKKRTSSDILKQQTVSAHHFCPPPPTVKACLFDLPATQGSVESHEQRQVLPMPGRNLSARSHRQHTHTRSPRVPHALFCFSRRGFETRRASPNPTMGLR